MAQINTYRFKLTEFDQAQFQRADVGRNIGYIVIKAKKGVDYPVLITSKEEFLFWFGYPDKFNYEMLEALKAVEGGACWVVRALGKGALKGGVDVRTDGVYPFGLGRWNDYDPANIVERKSVLITKAKGNVKTFIYDLESPNEDINFYKDKINIIVGDRFYELSLQGSGNIKNFQNNDLQGYINLDTGDIQIDFNGQVGTPAILISEIDLSGGIQLTNISNKPYAIDIQIDNDVYKNVVINPDPNAQQPNTYTQMSIVSSINTAVGRPVAFIHTENNKDVIKIEGEICNPQIGKVIIKNPTDTDLYESAIGLFTTNSEITHQTNATFPTGNVPRYGEDVYVEYFYVVDLSNEISHSFLTKSAYSKQYGLLGVKIHWLFDKRYKLTLYEWNQVQNKWNIRSEYIYSLKEEKDEFGRSLYVYDVFKDNPYLDVVVNPNYPYVAQVSSNNIVPLEGGKSGDDPTYQDYLKCIEYAKDRNKYRVKLFIDVNGKLLKDYLNINDKYQYFAEVVSSIPIGYSVDQAVQYRSSLGVDNDNGILVYKWYLGYDPYNDNFVWLNGVGSLAKMMLSMDNFFNALPVAGYNENGFGGEIDTYRVIDYEGILNDDELRILDENQINPFIYENGKIILWGQKTLTTQNTDTSYIPTRRVYNVILEYGYNTLRRQTFKFNDSFHRNIAKINMSNFVDPIQRRGYINDYIVICDESNNTPEILNQRKFILTLKVKATPTSEFIEFNFVRVGQNVEIK